MIIEIIDPKSIAVGLKATDKENLLIQMMDLVCQSGKVTNKEKAFAEILQRERIMSTGIGKGIALPHAKTDAVSGMAGAIAILAEPVDFDSLDNKKVEIIFMLLGESKNLTAHLKTISEISRYFNTAGFTDRLKQCACSEEILSLLA